VPRFFDRLPTTGIATEVLRWLKRLVSIGLLAVIVIGVARREGMGGFSERLASLELPWLALAAALAWVAALASARRWQRLLTLEGVERSAPWSLGSFLRGRFVGAFTPSTVGLDLYRLVDVGKGDRGAAGRALLVEKLYGLVALAMVSAALLPFGLRAHFGAAGSLLVLGLGLGSVLGVAMLERPALLVWLGRRLPRRLGAFALRAAEALRAGRPALGERVRLLGLGLVTHSATAAIFLATGSALGVEVGPLALVIVGNAIILATLLPISVGGVGVREGTAVAVLATQGVPAADAALLAFLGYLCAQPPALVGGLWHLFRTRPEGLAAVVSREPDPAC